MKDTPYIILHRMNGVHLNVFVCQTFKMFKLKYIYENFYISFLLLLS